MCLASACHSAIITKSVPLYSQSCLRVDNNLGSHTLCNTPRGSALQNTHRSSKSCALPSFCTLFILFLHLGYTFFLCLSDEILFILKKSAEVIPPLCFLGCLPTPLLNGIICSLLCVSRAAALMLGGEFHTSVWVSSPPLWWGRGPDAVQPCISRPCPASDPRTEKVRSRLNARWLCSSCKYNS